MATTRPRIRRLLPCGNLGRSRGKRGNDVVESVIGVVKFERLEHVVIAEVRSGIGAAANPDHAMVGRLADVMIDNVEVVIGTGRSVTLHLHDDTVLHRLPLVQVVEVRLLSRATDITCSRRTRRSIPNAYMEQVADSVIG